MKDGLCPKCGSHDVRNSAHVGASSGALNRIFIDRWSFTHATARLDIYVCVTCGYVESYVAEEKALAKIAEKWPRVGDEKRKRG